MPPHPEQQKKTSQLGGLNKNISSRDTSEVSELPPALGSCGNPLGRAGFPPLPKHPQEISPENMPNKLQGEKHSSHPLCPTKKKNISVRLHHLCEKKNSLRPSPISAPQGLVAINSPCDSFPPTPTATTPPRPFGPFGKVQQG